MERKTEEDVVMRTWKMKVGGHRKIGRPKLRWYKKRHEGEPRPENVEIENLIRRPQIRKMPKQYFIICAMTGQHLNVSIYLFAISGSLGQNEGNRHFKTVKHTY